MARAQRQEALGRTWSFQLDSETYTLPTELMRATAKGLRKLDDNPALPQWLPLRLVAPSVVRARSPVEHVRGRHRGCERAETHEPCTGRSKSRVYAYLMPK
ncbi:hypothetical protein [Streptomyces sp. Wb2n-11]|uniref:hypothetical protein n=1 Tax=Streptomyces sp. Wb2n-11 TaxID=1030533 RepID=UPI000B89FC5A|nr:hypothetical protein [Streptomyces sp. Wb2n-11]